VRILWASNSPYNLSGYGMQTMMVTPRIQGAGHDVGIAANYGVEGCTLSYEGPRGAMPVFPKGGEPHSIQITGEHAERWQADVIMTHYDAWVYELEHFKGRPWAPWFPIDCDALQTQVEDKVKHAAFRITQTRHGQAACQDRGLSCEYVPAAFSAEWYKPQDATGWREGAGIPEDAFLVAMIAANKGAPGAPSRKSFPQIFEGFKLFLAERPDAYLYVHTIMQGHLDLLELADRYGIQNNISFAHPYPLVSGHCSVHDMAMIYSAADVLLSPSMGEGFGVPIIEAQACGTPVITGDWTAMSEITRTGLAIPKSEAVRYPVPHSGKVYGDMFIVRGEAVRDALVEATTWNHDPAAVASAVGEYEISRVFDEHWVPVLNKLEATLAKPNRPHPSGLNRAQRRRAKIQGGAQVAA